MSINILHNPVIFLMGPSASGKTQLAMSLVDRFPFEIISVDSAMVYKGMNIGTAKPSKSELHQYPHHLIDLVDPVEGYSAGQFYQDSLRLITEIQARKKIPLLVGGTMLYFHYLQRGYSGLPKTNAEIAQNLQFEADAKGWPFLHEKLSKIDPQTANKINKENGQRIQRALGVYYTSGKTPSQWYAEQTCKPLTNILSIIVAPKERVTLHNRIEKRLATMLKKGFIEEVEYLYRRGDLHATLPAIKSVGYQQIWQYLAGNMNYEQMQANILIATRQLVRKQLIWLRPWENGIWFDNEDSHLLNNISNFLSEAIKEWLNE